MDHRENALLEALKKNSSETERWQAFKTENETTFKNLEMFAKQLTVQVMVPIGNKALMPGELIHTNEMLVGHYQGYFSTCSAHKAKEICRHRIHLAEDHLKKLKTEADLWQNKLNTPLLEGAVPSGEEIDIVEEYDEQAHSEWLTEHKKRVRKEKQEERKNRETEVNNEDVFKKLEEREMLEELAIEPDDLSDNKLDMLLQSMEISPTYAIQEKSTPNEKNVISDEQVFNMLDKLESEEQTEIADISTDAEDSIKTTNEMVRSLMFGEIAVESTKKRISKKPNQVNKTSINDSNNQDEISSADDEDVPEEVQMIRKEMTLLPTKDHVEFLNSQLNIIKAKMRKIPKENHMNNELNHLLDIVVYLEDDMQEIIYGHDMISDEDLSCDIKSEMVESSDKKKRRVSFALSDEKLEFRQNETIAEMLPKTKQIPRDVIKLDTSLQHVQTPIQNVHTKEVQRNSYSEIMQKVEQNYEFVKENQSIQAFDLVNQILEPSTGCINTLYITFSHSDAVPASVSSYDTCDNLPGSPKDFYTMYSRARAESDHTFPIYVNSFEGEEHLKVPILKEALRDTAYEDPRRHFSKQQSPEEAREIKSILRKTSAVEREPAKPIETKNKKLRNKKKSTIEDSLVNMSAYTKVMTDLVEREPLEPEPLPKGKFIDANTPKKRISRFKEQRLMQKS